ncbi:SusC/RagA family TonB-linked outer membrane protein [Pararcticibacter amylolyticus]|uniref:TonB-dependent receptor n=1 Tax=Pararcticibacter amylolyticus TaxID=2173175 RepID=A0A2U2PB74_9SPHI|nr:TonB-dependent receptor [Pararcticibacter amylolyticus]PWG78610.1 TonB-dependent receptor [Pararcticibacter amylolyticus]
MIKKLTLLVFLIFSYNLISAQSPQVIKGRIVDDTDAPLAGATVFLTVEKKTAVTNAAGNFSITSNNAENKLRVTFIGCKTREFDLAAFENGSTIVLLNDGNKLDEVIVVGYGTTVKKDLTGAVSTLSADLITDRKTTRVSQALQGAIPGVQVNRNAGTPGASGSILIRGITTLGVNDPLVIIDGVPGSLDNLNPDNIENVTVLKDAASSAIYGSRAAAGVILVTTKRAKDGQTDFNYNADFGLQKPTTMPEFVNAQTYMSLFNELKVNDGATPIYDEAIIKDYAALNAANPDKYPNTDWQKAYFKENAFQQRHDLNFTVGTRNVKTKVIAGYIDQGGLEPNRSFNRYSFRVNNDLRFNDKLNANVDFSYYRAQSLSATTSNISLVRQLPAIFDDYYSDGRYAPGKDGANPIANNMLGGRNNVRNNQFSARLQLNFAPVKGLKLSAIFAPQLGFLNSNVFSQMVTYTSLTDRSVVVNTFNNTNSLTQSNTYSQALNSQFLANYQISVANDHSFGFLLGYESNDFRDENSGAFRDGYVLPDYQVLDAGAKVNAANSGNASESALRSFFGRVNYNYKGKYLLQANARYDGSSRFAPSTRWGFFPSVSAGWVVSEEEMFKGKMPFSFFKIRGSWGRNGNQQIGNYSYQSLINLNTVLFYNAAGQIVPATAGNQLNYAVNDITWEAKQDFDIGMDMAFFRDRLSVTVDYFNKTTFDILLNLPIPLNTGLLETPQNGGKMLNKGWELQVGWNDRIGKDWKYSVSVNLSDYRNRVVDLKGTSTLGSYALLEGQPYNVWYGYKNQGYFKDAEDVAASAKLTGTEKPGDIKYTDLNGDGKITADKDQVPLGNSLPRYLFGGNGSVRYKNFDFGFSFQGVGKQLSRLSGFMVQPFDSNFGNVNTYYIGNYWTADRPNAKYPRLSYNNKNINYDQSSDFWFFKGSYIRIKDVTFGYTFEPSVFRRLGIKNARLFVSATDLVTSSHFPKGWDPEGTQGNNPLVVTYYTGLSVTF